MARTSSSASASANASCSSWVICGEKAFRRSGRLSQIVATLSATSMRRVSYSYPVISRPLCARIILMLVNYGLAGGSRRAAGELGSAGDLGSVMDRLLDQGPAEFPDEPAALAGVLQHLAERVGEQLDLGLADHERRDELDDLHVIARHLSQDPVPLEQRDDDHLREQADPGRAQRAPPGPRAQRGRPAELQPD